VLTRRWVVVLVRMTQSRGAIHDLSDLHTCPLSNCHSRTRTKTGLLKRDMTELTWQHFDLLRQGGEILCEAVQLS
jgi:hypothetical protein